MVVAFGGAESPEGDSLYAYPARESLWSPNGVAKIMQGAKPVRLAAEEGRVGRECGHECRSRGSAYH